MSWFTKEGPIYAYCFEVNINRSPFHSQKCPSWTLVKSLAQLLHSIAGLASILFGQADSRNLKLTPVPQVNGHP